ncbi:hypothetical protein PUR71_12800 [Streptomyces sp. SP17BM10]|uniref:hypothetical protein n=1 Tax=Streptomyces sp. SP17BM10 TaxID=3002530 RepID=UPI002E77F264|nr:hypothetical protein [Streptomyces sp. SP17BM10]MEE1783778.1 hypothetical protein [Streptomyces sp. SP17BM10]
MVGGDLPEAAMDDRAETHRIVERFFAERESATRTSHCGTRDEHAARQRFARTGRLDPDDALQLRMWAVNRALAAYHRPLSPAQADRALHDWHLIARLTDPPPPEAGAPGGPRQA